jgi:hypothetical protein
VLAVNTSYDPASGYEKKSIEAKKKWLKATLPNGKTLAATEHQRGRWTYFHEKRISLRNFAKPKIFRLANGRTFETVRIFLQKSGFFPAVFFQ